MYFTLPIKGLTVGSGMKKKLAGWPVLSLSTQTIFNVLTLSPMNKSNDAIMS